MNECTWIASGRRPDMKEFLDGAQYEICTYAREKVVPVAASSSSAGVE